MTTSLLREYISGLHYKESLACFQVTVWRVKEKLENSQGVDLTLLTRTEDLRLRTNNRKRERVLSTKRFFLFQLWSPKCTSTVETRSVRIFRFSLSCPNKSMLHVSAGYSRAKQRARWRQSFTLELFQGLESNHSLLYNCFFVQLIFSKYWEDAVLLAQRPRQQNLRQYDFNHKRMQQPDQWKCRRCCLFKYY